MPERRTTVKLVAGRKNSGEPVYEEVLVDREGPIRTGSLPRRRLPWAPLPAT